MVGGGSRTDSRAGVPCSSRARRQGWAQERPPASCCCAPIECECLGCKVALPAGSTRRLKRRWVGLVAQAVRRVIATCCSTLYGTCTCLDCQHCSLCNAERGHLEGSRRCLMSKASGRPSKYSTRPRRCNPVAWPGNARENRRAEKGGTAASQRLPNDPRVATVARAHTSGRMHAIPTPLIALAAGGRTKTSRAAKFPI